jgi:hypothetical protein
MRDLWVDHAYWMREVMLALRLNTSNLHAAQEKLAQNQHEISTAFGSYYGKVSDLRQLLAQHTSASQVQNAHQIGQFIHKHTGCNVTDALLLNIDLTIRESQALAAEDFAEAASIFKKILHDTRTMSDEISNAIAKTNWWTMHTNTHKLPCCQR